MSQAAQSAATFNLGDFKVVTWLIGMVLGAAMGGISVTWWFSKQLQSLKDCHREEMDILRKDSEQSRKGIYGKMAQNREDCQNTKNRVSLLEQAHTQHSRQMEKMEGQVEQVQRDVQDTKQQVSNLGVKLAEGNMAILNELRNLKD